MLVRSIFAIFHHQMLVLCSGFCLVHSHHTGEYFFQSLHDKIPLSPTPAEPAQQLLLSTPRSHQLAGSIFLIPLQLVGKMAAATVPHTRGDSLLRHCRNKRTPTRCALPAWVIPQRFPILWGTFPSTLDTAKHSWSRASG